jgi:uncharacterized protein YbjT (DUF2867 family)
MKKILVIGSTGLLGNPTTRQLILSDNEVSLLTRNPGKTREIFPDSRIIEGDVFSEESLREAFVGQDIVYINLSVAAGTRKKDLQPEREGILNILTAAKKTVVKRIAYLSSLIKDYQGMNGFEWWAFKIKNDAVNAVKTSGIAYSIFYPSTFMETFINLVRGNNIYLVSGSRAPMWMISAEDYGRQVNKALEIAKGNQEFVIQGLEPFTWDEAAKHIIQHANRKLGIKKAPMGLVKLLGMFSPKINYGANILTALNQYPEKFESEETWSLLGKPTITLKEFAGRL